MAAMSRRVTDFTPSTSLPLRDAALLGVLAHELDRYPSA